MQSTPDGAALAWGRNFYGQTTIPAEAFTGVKTIAVGYEHTVALKNDGTVLAWGSNQNGQLDIPSTAQNGVVAISTGPYYTLALRTDGSVVGWGLASDGQTVIPPEAQSDVTAISAGDFYAAALKKDGSILQWGRTGGGGPPSPPVEAQSGGVSAIAVGESETMALKNGGVLVWGIQANQTSVPATALSNVVAISVSYHTFLALKNDGSVVGWGRNTSSSTIMDPTPQSNVIKISAGPDESMALMQDGSVVVWGWTGYPKKTPPPAAQRHVIAIAAGMSHLAVVVEPSAPALVSPPKDRTVYSGQNAPFMATVDGYPLNYQWRKNHVDIPNATGALYFINHANAADAGEYSVVVHNTVGSLETASARLIINPAFPGEVIAWGNNGSGQTNVPVVALSGITAVSAAANRSVALNTNGSVIVWGAGTAVQTNVPLAARAGVIAIAAGGAHTLALKENGSVVAWGANDFGQCDVPVAAQSDVVAIAAGGAHSVALKRDGRVVAWGYNDQGQTTVPPSAVGISAIAAKNARTSALKNNGSVMVWGNVLPAGSEPPFETQSGVIGIAASDFRDFALKADGSILVWSGSTADDIPAAAGSGVVAMAGGTSHFAALKGDGTIFSWGNNSYGQLNSPPAVRGYIAMDAGWDHTVALLGPIPLDFQSFGDFIQISWPRRHLGRILQVTSSLETPINWSDFPEQPLINGDWLRIQRSLSQPREFYQLIQREVVTP